MGVQALESYAAVGLSEDGSVGEAVAAVEVLPRACDDVLCASLSLSGSVGDVVLLEECFEVKWLQFSALCEVLLACSADARDALHELRQGQTEQAGAWFEGGC